MKPWITRKDEMIGRLDDLTRQTGNLPWKAATAFLILISLGFFAAVVYLFVAGVGIWGINQPASWGFAITNFVWWIGIGHAGTFISAFLLLARQPWRNSINRTAEAMTLFAIACAAMFPIFHLGRPELFYWIIPYKTNMELWPQYRSALVWDLMALTTYGLLSLVFWYVGLVPDMAIRRYRTDKDWLRRLCEAFSLGWSGTSRQWQSHGQFMIVVAALAAPLVISVHSIVSLDFAIGVNPGWHSTIFPPYFVAGALYSGFAMVMTLVVPMRKFYRLRDLITDRHLNNIRKFMVVTGTIVAFGYVSEHFFAWYSDSAAHMNLIEKRATGVYALSYWSMLIFNIGLPIIYVFLKTEKHLAVIYILSLFSNVGMWLERYIIVVTSQSFNELPAAWGIFDATFWDYAFLFGSIGFFFFMFFLFLRIVPPISIYEVVEEEDE